MALALYAHPFSSYCQKVLIALYENATPFELKMLDNLETGVEMAKAWPPAKMPVLVDDGRAVGESSVIIEYLQVRHPGPVRLIPEDADAALEARAMDRLFDNYVMTPVQMVVSDSLRPAGAPRDPFGVEAAKKSLQKDYGWLDRMLAGREWAIGADFSLADCAAGPSLFYADWVHPIGPQHANVRGYRSRLLARPSFARAVDEARQYRPLFPLGAPDRD